MQRVFEVSKKKSIEAENELNSLNYLKRVLNLDIDFYALRITYCIFC